MRSIAAATSAYNILDYLNGEVRIPMPYEALPVDIPFAFVTSGTQFVRIRPGKITAILGQPLGERIEERDDNAAVIELGSQGKNTVPGEASTNAIMRGLRRIAWGRGLHGLQDDALRLMLISRTGGGGLRSGTKLEPGEERRKRHIQLAAPGLLKLPDPFMRELQFQGRSTGRTTAS